MADSPDPSGLLKTSPSTSLPQTPPRASAQDGSRRNRARRQSSVGSPALSTTSTAGDEASPELPPLPAPRLPDRVRGLLGTPPTRSTEQDDTSRVEASPWGSPYPPHLRRKSSSDSLSSDSSDDSPIHQLQLRTPFLRDLPPAQESPSEPQQSSSISAAAAVLANRARRVANNITEGWIRQHTTAGTDLEKRHWFSDGTGDSENSSLSGSFSSDDAAWLGDNNTRTPRASRRNKARQTSRGHPRKKSSSETLRQAHVSLKEKGKSTKMASSDERATPDIPQDDATPVFDRPSTPKVENDAAANGSVVAPSTTKPPSTPSRAIKFAPGTNTTPRFKKKLPWKGKNIMIHLPKDDGRGQPGHGSKPLTQSEVAGMLRSWEELGYNTDGFELDSPSAFAAPGENSQSRGAWPDFDDMIRERKAGSWRVLLPDLNAWKQYVDELNEAKLRALGVSFGEEEAPPPSTSPGSTMSRQASVAQYPPLPFSPPLPASSASSNHGATGFPFPLATSGTQSPGIPAGVSPTSFAAKFNPRASISIPSPHAWSPQLMLHQGHRAGSPSLANLNAIMSPSSPFSLDGMPSPGLHQRHQSLQFPVLPHQFQQPVRASPRLQDLREVEEEALEKSPSKTPEPGFVSHGASDSLQKEIEEAEYHLEEQMRSQIENDEDYSPHNGHHVPEDVHSSSLAHGADSLVPFTPQAPLFGGDADGIVLHHPRPHSRGHSLSQKYFTEDDVSQDRGFGPSLQEIGTQPGDEDEVETNPSNLGTPIQAFDFPKMVHGRSFSTASNPWTDNESGKSASGNMARRPSHGSKSSMSKLNVEAPEFKFNPANTFQPGQFMFSSNSFQPTVFNAGLNSATSSQFSLPTTISSKINAAAPAFSPGQSDFSFSASVPKFRPDAPAFTPHSLSNSLTSPVSGNESGSNRPSSIFGNIDLKHTNIVLPAKKCKAIPIVKPDSRPEQQHDSEEAQDSPDGRPQNEARAKRARATNADDNTVPLFAQPSEEATPVPESRSEKTLQDEDVPVEEKSFDESQLGPADTMVSSTILSETTDTKASSPAETSPDQAAMNWSPFEFKNSADVQNFAEARPFGEDAFQQEHKKSLSANAKAFVPGGSVLRASTEQPDVNVDDLNAEGYRADGTSTAVDELVRDDLVESVEPVQDNQELPADAEAALTPKSPLPEESQPIVPVSSESATRGGLGASRYASPPPPPKRTGLAASRFAASPSPVPDNEVPQAPEIVSPLEADEDQQMSPLPVEKAASVVDDKPVDSAGAGEPSMADIDAIMRHLNENPNMGVNRSLDAQPERHMPSPNHQLAPVTDSSPLRPPPQNQFRSDAPSPSPRQYHPIPDMTQPVLSTELDDPFVDPPRSAQSYDGPIHRLNGSESLPASDWEGAFSQDEQAKLESRVNFFDGHVNELVDGLLAARLGPLEETLYTIKHALATVAQRASSNMRERRSISAEMRDSDADDEDDELPVPRRSMSPRRDRRMEQIRSAVLDAFATQQRTQPKEASPAPAVAPADDTLVLRALEEMKEQFSKSLQVDFRSNDLRTIIGEAVESRIPPAPQPVISPDTDEKVNELQARIDKLEQRLQLEQNKVEEATTAKRTAEDRAADLNRELQSAATKIEVEMMNKSALNQRITDLEDRVHHFEHHSEEEVKLRRAAEDRLSEVQRLLRISSEEEIRLREVVEEKEQKMKALESTHSKSAMRLALLEANQSNSQQSQSEGQNRINLLETELRDARQQVRAFQAGADRLEDLAHRRESELNRALDENRALHKLIDTLGTQVQENERIRDSWRTKFLAIQEELARAAHEVTEENARRTKKEQAMLARQEVLDARLQAEARTRERIETELERLEMGERQGMRAVAECKRLESHLGELRTENHKLQQSSLRYQAEFQEARDSAAREVKRTREAMQAEVENANHLVNVTRSELEDQISNLRAQLDNVRMDSDTAKAQHEMLLEEAQNSKQAELEELARKHQNEMEDLQARYERQINNTTEDAQREEQNLLERLSISTSKTNHLQDRVAHLEEKLEIAKQAALAAAQAAKSSVAASSEPTAQPKPAVSRQMELPEKISPQALRESIMVLQEQLQEREHRIEELEQTLSQVDPEADTKISKRDDEIIWLRELLAVRHSDLQDIILALSREDYDKNAIKDATIRLKANLQMEQQERERAMNGGSAINLPNIAATIREAATPRVAQAVGPLAAAWGNWRKGRGDTLSNVLSSPAPNNGHNSTPSKSSPSPTSFLGGLLTPPASNLRQSPQAPPPADATQPTAFSSTGRRFTAQDLANRPRGISTMSSSSARQESKMPARDSPPRRGSSSGPVTPPMKPHVYDPDAQVEDFDDAGFFDD